LGQAGFGGAAGLFGPGLSGLAGLAGMSAFPGMPGLPGSVPAGIPGLPGMPTLPVTGLHGPMVGGVAAVPVSLEEKEALVEEIKMYQRTGDQAKEVWYTFCKNHGSTNYDPARHEGPFLKNFQAVLKGGPMPSPLMAMASMGGRSMAGGQPGFPMGARQADLGPPDPAKQPLVDECKAMQRAGSTSKEQWHYWCRMHGSKDFDPARHDVVFLSSFLSAAKSGSLPTEGFEEETPADDAQKLDLVAKVKAFQRSNMPNKELWYNYCKVNGKKDFDPGRHLAVFLQAFLDSLDPGKLQELMAEKGGKGSSKHEVSNKVFVCNMPKTIKEEEVKAYFETFGAIQSITMKHDEFGKLRGFCFIAYETLEGAKAVLANYDNNMIQGVWVEVQVARPGAGGKSAMPEFSAGKGNSTQSSPWTPTSIKGGLKGKWSEMLAMKGCGKGPWARPVLNVPAPQGTVLRLTNAPDSITEESVR